MKIHSEYTFSKAEFASRKSEFNTADAQKGIIRNIKDTVEQQIDGIKTCDNDGSIDQDPRKGFVRVGNENAGIIGSVPDGKFEAWQRNLEFDPKSGEATEYKGYKLDVDDSKSDQTTLVTRNQFAYEVDGQGRKHYHENFFQKNVDHANATIANNDVSREVVLDDKVGTITLIEDRNVEKKNIN